MKKSKSKLMNLSEFAASEHVTRAAARRWISKGLPVEADGRIDSAKARPWLAAQIATNGRMETLADAVLRKERALATLREIEVATRSGEVVAIADFQAAMSTMIAGCRARLLSIPAALAPSIALESNPACESLL